MTNEEKFLEVYTRKLEAAVQKYPEQYVWEPGVSAAIVAHRMIAAIKRGSFAMSPTIKSAAKELGIGTKSKEVSRYVND